MSDIDDLPFPNEDEEDMNSFHDEEKNETVSDKVVTTHTQVGLPRTPLENPALPHPQNRRMRSHQSSNHEHYGTFEGESAGVPDNNGDDPPQDFNPMRREALHAFIPHRSQKVQKISTITNNSNLKEAS